MSVKEFSYDVDINPDFIVDYAFSNDRLDLNDILINEIEYNTEYFTNSLMYNLLYDEINNGEFNEELQDSLYKALNDIDIDEWRKIIRVSDYENYDIDMQNNRAIIGVRAELNMERLYKDIVNNLSEDEITRFLNEPVRDISWVDGEFKVTTVGGEHFTIHKDGSVTIDDEMQEFDKADMKNKNKGVER